jgi:hypothetical protein
MGHPSKTLRQLGFGTFLIVMSAVVYYLHYRIFNDAHHILIFLVSDITFVFVEVLLVTLVLHQLLEERSKQELMKKMNMVIGTFFSEVGNPLLRSFTTFRAHYGDVQAQFETSADWSKHDFKSLRERLANVTPRTELDVAELPQLRDFLTAKRAFLLGLLQNPNLLEHDAFSDLLWAVFHLTEELECRTDVTRLSDTDRRHLTGDITRAHHRLVLQWLDYMDHLRADYPYLYSLAVRTNPFDPHACAEVRS